MTPDLTEWDGTEAEALDDMLENGDEDSDNFLPVRTLVGQLNGLTRVEATQRYEVAKAAKPGSDCICPRCSKTFKKKSYQQAFCSNKGPGNCKDIFWNVVRPERAQRAKFFANCY